MFDEKQIEQYRSITAPQTLKVRVMAQENKCHKTISFSRKVLYAAACIAVVVVSAFAFGNGGESVSISSAPMAVSRSANASVMLDVDVKNKAVITVSGGVIKTPGGEETSEQVEIYGDEQIEWLVDYDETYTLTVENGKKIEQYSLGFNAHSQMWEFEKIK